MEEDSQSEKDKHASPSFGSSPGSRPGSGIACSSNDPSTQDWPLPLPPCPCQTAASSLADTTSTQEQGREEGRGQEQGREEEQGQGRGQDKEKEREGKEQEEEQGQERERKRKRKREREKKRKREKDQEQEEEEEQKQAPPPLPPRPAAPTSTAPCAGQFEDVDVRNDGDTPMLTTEDGVKKADVARKEFVYPGDFGGTFRVVMVGPSGVGKSALLFRYCDHAFSDTKTATIGLDYKYKDLLIGDTPYRLNIFDTAGQERFGAVSKSYYRGAHGVILVYDISNRDSFLRLGKWFEEALERAPLGTVLCVVGTKLDKAEEEGGRQVTTAEGRTLAEGYGAAVFCEVSSKSGKNARTPFLALVSEMMQTPGLLGPANTRPYPKTTVVLDTRDPAWMKYMMCVC